MATINTDLVLASVPDVDIAGAIAGGISSYYGVKEMQDAQAERGMLLEQRENELWSSNYNRWKEWGNFVDPANADDYIAKGLEMGVYDQDSADMMLEQLQGVRATGLPKLQHQLDAAMGVQAKSDALMAERQQLEDEMAQVGGMQTPTAYARQQQLSSRASEIDAEMQNLSGRLETFDIPSLQEQHQAAYDTSMASVQSAMNMWRGLGDAYEAFNAGEPYEMYKFNEETGQIETTNVTSEEELETRGDEGWEVTSPELGTYYDTDANAHIGTPQMAYRKGWSEDEPTVTEEEDVTGGYTGAAGQFYQVMGRAPESGEELAEFEARGEKTVADETELGALLREQAKYEPGTSEYKAYGAAIQKEVGTVTDTVSTGMADYKAIYGKAPATEKEYLDFLAGKAEATQQVTKPSLIREYQETHDGKTPNEEQFIAYLQRRNSATADTEQITVDADGNINITKGIPAGDLGVVARNTMEKGIIEADEAITRMGNIQSKYDPSYLKTPEMFRQAINTWKDKLLSGQPLSTEDSQSLRDYTEFRQAAYNNLNKTLNALSGAAISPAEAERLMEELPNPGKEGIMGVLTGDSPEQFESSLDAALATQRMIKARLMYMRNNGFEPIMSGGKAVAFVDNDGVNIGYKDMPNIMQEHADSLFDQYKKQYPKMDDVELDNMAFIQTQKHFGLR